MKNYSKIIFEKFNEVSVARLISVFALFISIAGLSISTWNITISKHSFNHALMVNQKEKDKRFEKLRLDFLIQLADDMEIMDRYLVEIYKLNTQFDAEPRSVKSSMEKFLANYTESSMIVTLSLAKLSSEWKIILSDSNKNDYPKMIIDKATFYRDFKTNIVLKGRIQNGINEFAMNLQKAEKKNKVYPSSSDGKLSSKIFSPEVSDIPIFNDYTHSK